MRRLLFATLGLMSGLGVPVLWGCVCPDPKVVIPIATGTYEGVVVPPHENTSIIGPIFATPEDDYRLVISPDYRLVTETFTRDGHRYELQYQITDKNF